MRSIVPILSVVTLCGVERPCVAQQTRVVPSNTATRAGNAEGNPFSFRRFQQLIDGGAFCNATAILGEFAFRRDSSFPLLYPATTLSSVTLRVGYSKRSSLSLSLDTATNWSGTPTVAFKGRVDFPQNPFYGTAYVHPFNALIKFAQPLPYIRARGALLFEIEIANARQVAYYIDGWTDVDAGSVTPFGVGGVFADKDRHKFSRLPSNCRVGRTTQLIVETQKNYPTLAILGTSDKWYGALPLPFSLSGLGAPGNHLYVSMDAITPIGMQQLGRWFGAIVLAIPPDPRLAQKQLFVQVVSVDPRANSLGLVWSNAFRVSIAPIHHTQAIYSPDGTTKNASYFTTYAAGGVIVRLGGQAFN